ncbi:hypothetical protein BD779DRAFT_1668703 [Infundibulicybe gibba]|nr:hypothetical protein BD779DRAFT_1668703 [Infundibulicybe gibba]
MSVNHGSLAAHIPQSLPSFAQAFSNQSLGNISSGNNSLPPIQTHLTPTMENRRVHSPAHSRPPSEENPITTLKTAGTKRCRIDVSLPTTRDESHSDSERGSSPLISIKEEQDHDMLDPSPAPSSARPHLDTQTRIIHDTAGAPPPSSLLPPSKKRRVTISGAPHPLNTDVRIPPDQTNSTPISPVVMGFTIKRDNPSAFEQVRSMITVKQKQKELIEQRRGSVAGVLSTGSNAPQTPIEERIPAPKQSGSARTLRRSPNTGTGTRRITNGPGSTANNPRPPSPSPIIVPSQQPLQVPSQGLTTMASANNALPPPPISFARRRANQIGGGKKKPADIVISPREAQTREQFQPAIQSAPPVPHAGQGPFLSGRFPMTLPRLPSVMGGGDNVRRVASNVPPTPTRLSLQRNHLAHAPPPTGRSPPAASIPIASTLVPPTPSTFQRPDYPGDKSAFLAPFGVFYDALNDSKQLKNWLGDQLQRSHSLIQSLTQQQEKIGELVDSLVDKKVAGMRSEMVSLNRRVEELEDALRAATSGHRQSTDLGVPKSKGKQPLKNGITAGPRPAELMRRPSSPGWGQDRESRENHPPDPEHGSPAPFEARRLSVSASRLDPPRTQAPESSSQQPPRSSFPVHSPPQGFRDTSNHALAPPPPTHGKPLRGGHIDRERPGIHRQGSHLRTAGPSPDEQGDSPRLRDGVTAVGILS